MPPAVARTSFFSSTAEYQSGVAAFEAGRFAEAIAILGRVAGRGDLPGSLAKYYLGQAHLRYGLNELAARRFATAAEHLQAASTLNPRSDDLGRHLAACFIGQNRFDLAAREFERDLARGPANVMTEIRLALSLWKQGEAARAIETLQAATRHHPQRSEPFVQLGLLHAAADDYRLALEAFRAAARLAPLDAGALQHLGLTCAALADWSGALEHLGRAQQLRPHDAHLAMQLALAARSAAASGVTPAVTPATPDTATLDTAAIERLGQVVLNEPDFVEAFLALPRTGLDREVFAVLARTLEWATARQPELADLHYHCSRIYERLGQTRAAIDAAHRAVSAEPRFVQALIQLGRLYGETDQTLDAIDRLHAAIDAGGDYPDVHYLLGRLHQRRGETPSARRAFERALTLNAGYRAAREALAELAAA
ncbi:MAG: tetratricopeptide repeat protein [Phycisphaerae bacterium]